MSIAQRLVEDLKTAMKAGDKPRTSCLRMLRAKLLEREVALRPGQGREVVLDDAQAVEAIAAYAKQRRDAIDSFRQAGREDLVAQELAELEILAAYLPRQLADEEIRAELRQAIAEAGASSARDLGAVMKLAMPRLKGAVDGRRVQELLRELLA
ncbi:MAG TPA: GatB/YqeY domain-containing protein [Candidatus Polarisedimenticolaceae bacterium]|nr:GatB/YqeY domain-containing protein [Candidatus Polarisedimenticolaceae bacterium]